MIQYFCVVVSFTSLLLSLSLNNHLHHLKYHKQNSTANQRQRERECHSLTVQLRTNPVFVGWRNISRIAFAISTTTSPLLLGWSAQSVGESLKSLKSSPTFTPSPAMESLLLSSSLGLPGSFPLPTSSSFNSNPISNLYFSYFFLIFFLLLLCLLGSCRDVFNLMGCLLEPATVS